MFAHIWFDSQLLWWICNKIRAVRLEQNITQQSLAESSSVSLSSVKKAEGGEISSFGTLLRIMRILGILDELNGLCEEQQLSPSEYYAMVNSANKHRRKRAVGRIQNKQDGPKSK